MSIDCKIENHSYLKNIDFSLQKGELIVVIGTNGAGKSTLLREMIGFTYDKKQQYKISIENQAIASLSLRELAKKISYIPQDNNLAPSLTLSEFISLGKLPFGKVAAYFSEDDKNELNSALEICGLSSMEDRLYGNLSGGEKMRSLIAQALFKNSPYLFADEPLTGLDIYYQFKIMDMFKKLSKDNYACLLVLHDIQHALSYADKILILEKGHQIIFDTPKKIIETDILSKIFRVNINFIDNIPQIKPL